MELSIDFETRSTIDLRKAGMHAYAEHPSTDVWCMAFAFGEEDVHLWEMGQALPERVANHVSSGGKVYGHNVGFEIAIWNRVMASRHGWPVLDPGQCHCTAAMARAMALPGDLARAAAAVSLDTGKDMEGRRLMLQMCRPRRVDADGTVIWWDDADRHKRLGAYCKQDVAVERDLAKRLIPLSAAERTLWLLDFEINERGLPVDTLLIQVVEEVADTALVGLDKQMRRVTGQTVPACSNSGRLSEWVNGNGVATDSVDAATVSELLNGALPETIRHALTLRQEAAKSSLAKLGAMQISACSDGRIRGLLLYHGAGTGRWAGMRIQPHNLPRPDYTQNEIETILERLAGPEPQEEKVRYLETIYGPTRSVLATCLRAMIRAKSGNEFICGDFSAIEARVLAWLAGQQDILEVFERGEDIYLHTASKIDGADRFIGKVATLALGYQGGKVAFAAMARAYGVEISEEKAEDIKQGWRDANAAIVDFWSALESASMDAVRFYGEKTQVGPITFRASGSFLWCLLPSGRTLCFPYPSIEEREMPWGGTRLGLRYLGINQKTNAWESIDTYGGKLAENVTQAVARDLLAEALIRVTDAGFHPVLHVHDEILCEEPVGERSLDELLGLMTAVPQWAEGCPIAAEGWQGERYRK